MSAKPPIPLMVVALVCGVVAWSPLAVLILASEKPWLEPMLLSLLLVVAVWVVVFLAGLVLRDTIRQRGAFGINFFKRIVCPQCGTPLRRGITILDWKELYYGGWTCHECGIELSQWGRPWKVQNPLAKWAVLAAEDANQHSLRPQRRDERIRNVNDQTQRGDVS